MPPFSFVSFCQERFATSGVFYVFVTGELRQGVHGGLQHRHAVLVDDLQLELGLGLPAAGRGGRQTLQLAQPRLRQTHAVLGVGPRQVCPSGSTDDHRHQLHHHHHHHHHLANDSTVLQTMITSPQNLSHTARIPTPIC